jgi:elongation factor 1-alpha
LAFTLGIRNIIVCVNKMDKTSAKPYDEVRFNEIKAEATNFLKKLGYKEENM